jgi:hypothetical protein
MPYNTTRRRITPQVVGMVSCAPFRGATPKDRRELLEQICAGKLRKADELREAGALTHVEGETASRKGKKKSKG